MHKSPILLLTRFTMFRTGILTIYLGFLGVGAIPTALEAFEGTRYAVHIRIDVYLLIFDHIGHI